MFKSTLRLSRKTTFNLESLGGLKRLLKVCTFHTQHVYIGAPAQPGWLSISLQHAREDPREDVGVDVGVVECGLNCTRPAMHAAAIVASQHELQRQVPDDVIGHVTC